MLSFHPLSHLGGPLFLPVHRSFRMPAEASLRPGPETPNCFPASGQQAQPFSEESFFRRGHGGEGQDWGRNEWWETQAKGKWRRGYGIIQSTTVTFTYPLNHWATHLLLEEGSREVEGVRGKAQLPWLCVLGPSAVCPPPRISSAFLLNCSLCKEHP